MVFLPWHTHPHTHVGPPASHLLCATSISLKIPVIWFKFLFLYIFVAPKQFRQPSSRCLFWRMCRDVILFYLICFFLVLLHLWENYIFLFTEKKRVLLCSGIFSFLRFFCSYFSCYGKCQAYFSIFVRCAGIQKEKNMTLEFLFLVNGTVGWWE